MIIDDNPTLAIKNETIVVIIVHNLYEGPLGNISENVWEKLVTRPIDVLRQATVVIAARRIVPAVPK